MSDELQTTREAELRFLRAFYYWHIAETWGDVHFTTEETQGIPMGMMAQGGEVPGDITPVDAPFEMAELERPSFPDNTTFDIRDYGARQ